MIVIDNLKKYFDTFCAVDGISFQVEKGEVLGFLGPNGAGKSTTMKMITGFLPISSGTAEICGYDIQQNPIEAKKKIGYLSEGAPAYTDMTVQSYLSFIADIRELKGIEKKNRLNSVIEKINLEQVYNQPIETLSKGYKRRVGLAQALIHDPEILILDEPTDGLDPNQKFEVRSLIQKMAKDKAIVISTHILEEVEASCSRAIIINHGKIIADGTPSSLRADSEFHNNVILSFKGDVTKTWIKDSCKSLNGLPEVLKAEILENDTDKIIRIYPEDKKQILDVIGNLAKSQKWPVQQIHQEVGKLDDVFRKVTQ